MRKIILAMAVILSASVLAFAESCSSAGATERKHTPQGECDYKTETRTCCEDGNWSDWDKTCKPKYKECEEGDEGTGIYKLYSDGDKLVGHKNCKRVCKNGKWEYKFVGISCTNGFIEGNGGVDGKVCFIGKVGKTARIKGKPNTNKTPEGPEGLPAGYTYNQKCYEAEHGYWRYEGEDEANGVTNYLQCQFHGYWNSLMGKSYSIHRVSIDYVPTYPDGCDDKNNNLTEAMGAWCTNIGECGYWAGYTDNSAIYKQCQISDTTEWNEDYSGDSECVHADY